ncbi:MAG TPA: hypothetical protein VNB90_12805 [Cytophagaceae bacterium]|nr:hypothetical protein [Cytophagaceae bacterium]
MLNKKISDLPLATALTDNDLFAVMQSDNTTRKINFVDMIREVNAIVEISFADLTDLIAAGTMSPGTMYQIEFQTKHMIPNTSVINTGVMEHLLLYAVSGNDLLEEAISIEYPQDLILYNVNDVLCEDGTTPRQGKITYRKDRIKNLETWYDFRAVKFRRWKMDTASNTAWAPSTSYSSGNVVYNGNIFYNCIDSHTSLSSFNDDHWQIIAYGDTIKNVAWDSSIYINGTINSNASIFEDLLTFNFTDIHDITIKPMYNRSQYNNIVFVNYYGSDIPYGYTFEENCSNMTIVGSHNQNSFGQNCSSVILGNDSSTSGITDNVVGNDLQGAYFSNSAYNTIGNYCGNIVFVNGANKNTIENSVWQTNIESAESCHIASNSYNVKIESSSYILIGSGGSNNRFTSGSSQNTVGMSSSNNTFVSSQYNLVGDACSGNQFSGSYDNRIGSNCYNNSFTSSGTTWINSESSNNTFNGSYNIIIGYGSGSNTFNNSPYNWLGNSCNGNTFTSGSYDNVLEAQCFNNHFNNAAYNSLGTNSNNNSITSSYRISLGIECDSNTFTSYCDSVTLGNNSDGNTLSNAEYSSIGNGCSSNTLTDAYYISLGNYCSQNHFTGFSYNNSMGNNCNTNTLVNNSSNNSFGNNCSNNTIGDNTNGGSSNNNFANNCNSNFLGGANNNNSLGSYCSNNSFGIGASTNTLENNCNNNLLAYTTGSSSGSFSNNHLGGGCNNINLRGNGLIFGEACSFITIDFSLNCQFAPGLANKTFPGQFNSAFMISDTTTTTFTTSGNKIIVNMCSADGSWWFNAIDNAGVVTTTKFV